MSLHSSLKTSSGALNSHRNVLTRNERIERLVLAEKFDLARNSALGLVKVRSIKVSTGKKKKTEGEGAEGTTPAAGGAAAKPGAGAAAGAKPAAGAAKPAAGSKPAAGAAGKDAGAKKK